MAGYVVVELETSDHECMARYRELSGPSVERHGGRFLVRGGRFELLEGDWNPERLVVIEFPSVEQAREWYESEDYREARDVRAGAARLQMLLVEGYGS